MSATLEPIVPAWGMIERDYILNGEQPAALSAGVTTEIDLDADALYSGVDIQGTYTYTAGTGGTLRVENPFSLIAEIQLIAGNGDILQRMSGYEAFLLAQIARGPSRPLDFDRTPATTTAVTNGRFVIPLDLTFVCGDGAIEPAHFGATPARYLNAFKLRITYASSLTDAVGYGMGGSPAVTGSIAVYKRLVRADAPAPQGYGSRIVQAQPTSIASTTSGLPFKVEAGVRYAGFLIVNRDTANAALSDAAGFTGTLVLTLDTGVLRFRVTATMLRQLMRARFPTNYKGVTTAFDLTGTYFLDAGQLWVRDDNGKDVTLGQALDATQAREVRLELDVTAGTSTVVRLVPLRVRAVQQSALAMSLPVQ